MSNPRYEYSDQGVATIGEGGWERGRKKRRY